MSSGPDALELILTQLAYQAPFVLVYLGGIVLALAKMRRHRTAATLALVALVILLLVTLAAAVVQGYFLGQLSAGGPARSVSAMLTATGWLAALLKALGTALLIFAVFAGRRSGAAAGD